MQEEADAEGSEHKWIIPVVHAENGKVYISHADCMKKLGKSKYSKGIGLGAQQNLRIREDLSDMFRGKRYSCLCDAADRYCQVSDQADSGDQ